MFFAKPTNSLPNYPSRQNETNGGAARAQQPGSQTGAGSAVIKLDARYYEKSDKAIPDKLAKMNQQPNNSASDPGAATSEKSSPTNS